MGDRVISDRKQTNRRLTLTEQLLKSIAYHLSRHKVCKGASYVVKIDDECISVNTDVRLCMHPNGKRTNTKVPAIHHIIFDHFPDLYKSTGKDNKLKVCTSNLELGTYEYKISTTRRSRRWFRVR